MQTIKKEVLGFRTLVSKIGNYFSYTLQLNYYWFQFKEIISWYIKCCLNFWRLPKLLEQSLDYFYATESANEELHESIKNKDNLIEALMYEIEDRIWSDQLKDKEYSEISDEEKKRIHKIIKAKYDQHEIYCPSEFMTDDEVWDRAEIQHENSILSLPGGPDHDERGSVINSSTYHIKKSKFKSRYYGDWGIGGFDVR